MEARQRDRPGKGRLKRWAGAFIRSWLADLLLVGGGAAVTAGAAMVYPPAGWLVGGGLAMALGVLAARGSNGGGKA